MRANVVSRRLTLNDAIEIWRRRSSGEAQHKIAAAFEVNQGRISEILAGKRFPAAKRLAQNAHRDLGAASEQQIFMMGFRAKRKYRQITVAGDVSQRLHVGGIERLANAFPYIAEPIRQITLDTNFRQSKSLARLSNCFRTFTDGGARLPCGEPCGAPVYTYDDQQEFAEFVASKISALPGAASVVVISPTSETVRTWFDMMAPSLESAFRNPIISDRARLTERLKTHFTTPLEAKGLEFDVAVVPDISEFSDKDPIDLNGLYVAVSRPRYAIRLGCNRSRISHNVVKQLCSQGDLSPISLRALEVAA
jgi:transcriptional regulator with XRE-family HTH domain